MATGSRFEPTLNDGFERCGVDVVELVPALATGLDQTRSLENLEVLRDRLPRRAKPVFGRQPRADLKERLAIPVGQLVEDCAARGIGQGLEDVTHTTTLCKQLLACQGLPRAGFTRPGHAFENPPNDLASAAMRLVGRQDMSGAQIPQDGPVQIVTIVSLGGEPAVELP